eukprot:CAMPEP_0206500436 /NCGR_PEP_ID=MMETSP0324_2-20121206/52462_1 /ASSEMBLY_ACC=CAM_ASM_000836 /TAXON_ID=2866 /ORGANISM="Crypthecodinium cohnii, Strain Seligo" /LENGTH=75 /DNA_ID=CAMNT_0053987561 /DNA_START=286 /DNA_END=510 /DNA_ORIENTATION=-
MRVSSSCLSPTLHCAQCSATAAAAAAAAQSTSSPSSSSVSMWPSACLLCLRELSYGIALLASILASAAAATPPSA